MHKASHGQAVRRFIPTASTKMVRLAAPAALFAWLSSATPSLAFEYNTFDGPGFPSCYNVVEVHNVTSVDQMATLVHSAAAAGRQVRAAGKGHMWYDTQCSDKPTVIIRTEDVNGISDFDLAAGKVTIEAGVTFLQLAEYLHERGASVSLGVSLVSS